MAKIKAGFMFIDLLLVLLITTFIAFKVFKLHFKHPSLNPETQKVISEQNIDTTSNKSIIASTRDKLQDIQDKHFDEMSKLE